MQVLLSCNKDDDPQLYVLANDNVELVTLLGEALMSGKKVRIYNIDNAGVLQQYEVGGDAPQPIPTPPQQTYDGPEERPF